MGKSYEIEPQNKFCAAISSIVGQEIQPGNTVTLLHEVDLTEAERLRRQAEPGEKPSYTALVVKAAALALREFPYANRRLFRRPWLPWGAPRLQRFHHCDVAVACERNVAGAEMVASIDCLRDADQLSLAAITRWLRALATSDTTNNRPWRDFDTIIRWAPHWLARLLFRLPVYFPALWAKHRGGAVLISSPGKYGVDAILGSWATSLGISFGVVKERPVVRGGQVVARPTFLLTLNFDRRVMAGAQAARFFRRMIDILEDADLGQDESLADEKKSVTDPSSTCRVC